MAEEISKDILLAQVRECFGKVAWSHKTQECQASIYNNYHKRLIWAKILVAGLAAGSGIISLFSGVAIRYATAILSSLVLIIDLTFKNMRMPISPHNIKLSQRNCGAFARHIRL